MRYWPCEVQLLLKAIVPNVYAIQLGVVNAFLIVAHDLTLIDTGSPGSTEQILRAVASLGRSPSEINHILLSHCHPDHSGSLAELKAITGASAYMHPLTARVMRGEEPGRALCPAPGPLNQVLTRVFISQPPWPVAPVLVEHEVLDGDELPCAGGLEAIHVPGHCAGQLAFLYRYSSRGALLFAADSASNLADRLRLMIAYEDLQCGLKSLAKLSAFRFDAACFGHGNAIYAQASEHFRAKWGNHTASGL